MPDRKAVMISSTALDLPDHRIEIMDACLRQGMFPMIMEHVPALDAEAISASLALVDEADIYLGVFAHRYGYVPKENNPQQISITEMEYNRAVERGIPRLIFLMQEDQRVRVSDVEKGKGAIKLDKFKARLTTERVANYFKSPAELRANVIDSLSNYRERNETTFHYISDIPRPPEIYIAHPYTLLQTRDLIGRQRELNLLTDWVAKLGSAVYQTRIFNVVAIGGMGKSALTWKWFNDIAPHEMKPLAGRLWWSFYESDATFENFIICALAYVSGRTREDIEKNTKLGEREELLLGVLDREPFLFVLDGLERILIAYARMDANRLADDDLDQQTANVVAGIMGLPEGAAQSFTGQHRLRKTADPRAGNFLRRLARVRASRVLGSTRLYPADLQTVTGEPLPGSLAQFIRGLSDDDALSMWRTFGVSGSRDELLRLFHSFDSHPLLIQALAGEIAHYHRAPGDFDQWRSNHPDFDPFSLPLVQARSHILRFALRGLNEAAKRVLYTVAPFRMPATYDTLAALLIGEDKIFSNENELDVALMELEDRGLLGWDKRGNRYDLHPIVRGVVWAGLSDDIRRDVYTTLHAHFEAIPKVEDFLQVESLEDLTPAIELYNTLIGLDRYNEAEKLFYDRIDRATLYRLSASRQRVELLEMLFPDGLYQLPRLSNPLQQARTLNALAAGYYLSGQPGRALWLFKQNNAIQEREGAHENLSAGLHNLSDALLRSGALRESQFAALQSLVIERKRGDLWSEGVSLEILGLILATRGLVDEANGSLQRALRLLSVQNIKQPEGVIKSFMAQLAFWKADYAEAFQLANRAWKLANIQRLERDFIRAARLQGSAALELNDLARADERLHHALTRARAVNFVEEELPALVALAELRRRQGDWGAARELLDAVWEAAERGPYPLFHADALNVLAQAERDAGNTAAAVEAATQAYRKAWCDGPPFAYHWGLEAAHAHLNALGAPEPSDLLPYDESKHEPMPEVEIAHLDEQPDYVKPGAEQDSVVILGENTDARVHQLNNVMTFFEMAGYKVIAKNQCDLQVTPARPMDQENYGSSLVRVLGNLPTIEDIQEFCRDALLAPGSPPSGYKPAFLICPHLEPVHQLQAAVYRDKRLAVVPITYDWVLEANARGDQRKSLSSVLDAFVGREDPFRYSHPVSVPGDFYGRNEVIADLVRDLDRGQSVGLFGMRKIGKTSLIQHCLRTRTGPTIYIDCQSLTNPATVLRRLPKGLRDSLKKLLPKMPLPEFDGQDSGDLEALADAVNQDLQEIYSLYASHSTSVSKITLILDEVDRIVPDDSRPTRNMEAYELLFGTIRSLGQGVERILVCMVAGFSADITQKDIGLSRGVAGNPVYAFFNIHQVGPMSADEIALMMNGLGSRARVQFSEAGGLRLYEWSGGHPFLSRLLGSIIHYKIDGFDLKRTSIEGGEAYEVDEAAVDRAAIELLDDSKTRPYVAQILERLNEPLHRTIFKKLAYASTQGCTREELMKITRNTKSDHSIADTLNSLEVASLIKNEEGRFRLFSNLLNELVQQGYV